MAVEYLGSNVTDGTSLGNETSQKISLYGVTPITQRTSSNQAAVATTAATSTSPWGFSGSTQANAIVTLVNELRDALVAIGAIKGS